jgi:hypothetical protein
MADDHRRRLAECRRLAETGARLIALFHRPIDTRVSTQQVMQTTELFLSRKKAVISSSAFSRKPAYDVDVSRALVTSATCFAIGVVAS